MSAGQIVAVVFLAAVVILVLRNIRGHKRGGDGTDRDLSGGGEGGASD